MPKISKVRRYKDLEFWAEGGCVVVIDNRTGDLHVLPVRDWLERLLELNRGNSREAYPDQRVRLATAVDDGIAVAKEAKAQGDPLDPRTTAQRVKQRRRHMLFPTGVLT